MPLTRRTYKPPASKTIAQRLPNEILTEIIETMPKPDQLTFCRVSELFHRLCLPVLYRVVVLGDYERAKTFLELIAAHPGRAEAIRSFTVTERARVFHGT